MWKGKRGMERKSEGTGKLLGDEGGRERLPAAPPPLGPTLLGAILLVPPFPAHPSHVGQCDWGGGTGQWVEAAPPCAHHSCLFRKALGSPPTPGSRPSGLGWHPCSSVLELQTSKGTHTITTNKTVVFEIKAFWDLPEPSFSGSCCLGAQPPMIKSFVFPLTLPRNTNICT